MKQPIFCSDCKFYSGNEYNQRCFAPQNSIQVKNTPNISPNEPEYVTDYRYEFCFDLRDSGWIMTRLYDKCGKEARWFVKKD